MVQTVASAACIVLVLLSYVMYRGVLEGMSLQLDDVLRWEAGLVLEHADREYGERNALVPTSQPPKQVPGSFAFVYQIATREGSIILRSPGAPVEPLSRSVAAGYSVHALAGQRWRVYSVVSARTPVVVHTAESLKYRTVVLIRALRAVALPLIFALFLMTGLIGIVIERAFRPVRQLADDLSACSSAEPAPVDTLRMPIETVPLAVALNGLLERHAGALERERRFTADAAHELRTPLAALRAQAQVAARIVKSAEARRALENLQAGIDRATHLVGQLLALTRVEPGSSSAAELSASASSVVELVISELDASARNKEVELVVQRCAGFLPGPIEWLYLLVRNLLENAIQCVGAGGRVILDVATIDERIVLTVSDTGPGIPVSERQRVFERFYRIPDSPGPGSGLGLSIVKRVVELLSGQIELADGISGRGLTVKVTLPRPPPV